MIKNIALFFASPFIALGYVVALPFVGLYMFTTLGVEAALKSIKEELPESSEEVGTVKE